MLTPRIIACLALTLTCMHIARAAAAQAPALQGCRAAGCLRPRLQEQGGGGGGVGGGGRGEGDGEGEGEGEGKGEKDGDGDGEGGGGGEGEGEGRGGGEGEGRGGGGGGRGGEGEGKGEGKKRKPRGRPVVRKTDKFKEAYRGNASVTRTLVGGRTRQQGPSLEDLIDEVRRGWRASKLWRPRCLG